MKTEKTQQTNKITEERLTLFVKLEIVMKNKKHKKQANSSKGNWKK